MTPDHELVGVRRRAGEAVPVGATYRRFRIAPGNVAQASGVIGSGPVVSLFPLDSRSPVSISSHGGLRQE